MKTKWTLISLCLFSLLAMGAGLLVAHYSGPRKPVETSQHFKVNGVVRRLAVDDQSVTIEHEDIPGFMPAMTMPFTVKDSGLLHGLSAGDRVRFELVVTKDDSWISQIVKTTGSVGLEEPKPRTDSAQTSAAVEESRELASGEIVPDFTLIDQDGRPFRLADHRGQAVLITFLYTRCPLPNYCPLMSRNFASLQERLSKAFPGKFHLLTITFDPSFDTPEVLKRYAAAFRHDETTWTFATGTAQRISAVASRFGLIYVPEGGLITHDLRTALIAPDGHLVQVWRSNVWTPYEVQRAMGDVLHAVQPAPGLVSAVANPLDNAATR
jgi:protein SCO1/2